MKAADVMTRNVVSIHPNASISEAAQSMVSNQISGLPVVGEQGNLIGIVTESDLLRRVETGTTRRRSRWIELFTGPGQLASEYVQSHARRVEDVMTPNPEVVVRETPIEEIVSKMENKQIKRLPVLEGDQIVGIVSRANLVQALATLSHELKDTTPADTTVQERVLAEIANKPWSSAAKVNVIVRDGVVELWGTILDERVRDALRVAAENVPGVKRVNDHLVWIHSAARMGYA
jgi:CBS domain-containing protein